jgi:hypothetical protein
MKPRNREATVWRRHGFAGSVPRRGSNKSARGNVPGTRRPTHAEPCKGDTNLVGPGPCIALSGLFSEEAYSVPRALPRAGLFRPLRGEDSVPRALPLGWFVPAPFWGGRTPFSDSGVSSFTFPLHKLVSARRGCSRAEADQDRGLRIARGRGAAGNAVLTPERGNQISRRRNPPGDPIL